MTAAALTALSVGVAAGAAVAATNDPPSTTANPSLTAKCGLDVGLVLDGSGSIGSASATDQVRAAAKALLEPLRDTNTNAGVVTFATGMKESATVAMQPLTTSSYAGVFTTQINAYGSGGTTNWDLALRTANQNFIGAGVSADRPGVPNLLVFITDGAPNRYDGATKTIGAANYTSTSGTSAQLAEAAPEAVNPAITAANAIKGTGTRILTIGVGQALTSNNRSTFIETLRKVTAPVKANVVADNNVIPSGIAGNYNVQSAYIPSTTDMILVSDFTKLSAALADVANTLCSGSLTINKLASTPDAPDTYAPAAGWSFNAEPSAKNESYSWVLPTASSTDTNQTGTTAVSGKTTFQWDVSGSAGKTDWNANKGIKVTETVKDGFVLAGVTCKRADGADVAVSGFDAATGKFTVPVGVLDIITCDVKNKAQKPITVSVAKKAVGDTFYDDGTTIDFPLVVSGPAVPGSPKTLGTKAGSSSNVTLNNFQGQTTTVTVSEGQTPANWTPETPTAITCKVNNQSVSDGNANTAGFQLTLKPGDAVACTVTNRITAPAATVTVTKKWVIDGKEYANGALPEGFTAATLTLTGDNAPASPQFGTTYSGFKASKSVTIGETGWQVPVGCVNTVTGDTGTKTLAGGANTFSITNTVVCDAAIQVTKTWVIDGTTYANGQQPQGFTASLTLSPRKADGDFGAVVGGYKVNDTVTVGETTRVPEGCTVVKSGLGEKTLALRGVNPFTVTNTVSCPATVTVNKVWVVDGTTYDANTFPAGFSATATVDGEPATWGEAVTGFHRGQKVPVGETAVTVPADCQVVGEPSIDGPATLAVGGNTYTITNTAKCAATITVDKVWVVNGKEYADGDQPEGLSASLTLSKVDWPFGTAKTGFFTGDTVTIDETADLASCVTADDADGLGTVTLKRGSNVYTVTNYVTCVGDLKVTKSDADTGAPVTGGTFELYVADDSGQPVGDAIDSCTISSGNSCTIEDLPLGTYVWKETVAPTGYELPSDPYSATVTVTTGNAGTTQVTAYADAQKRTSIVVTKTDKESGDTLAGAEFTLWRDGGDGEFGGDDTQVSIPAQPTGSKGTTTFTDLLFGTYFVEESKAPLGYEVSRPSIQQVDISAENAGQLVELTFANPRKATTIVVTKLDKDLADAEVVKPLADFIFELRDAEGEYVDECTTEASGECTFEDVDFGTYTVVETGQADGYQADAPSQTVTVSAENAGVVKGLTFENSQKRTTLTVRKISASDESLVLEGAVFDLYAADEEGDPTGEPVGTCTTSDDGTCSVGQLLFGTYVWVERTAPTGYQAAAPAQSAPITVDEDTAGTTRPVTTFANPQKRTTLTVVKLAEEDGARLAGAVFDLYEVVEGTITDDRVGTCTTGEDGTCTIGDLPFGTYRWVEVQAPAGYVFPPVSTSGDVVVDAENAGTQVPATVVVDERIRTGVTVEKTGNRAPGFLGADDFFSVVESVRGATTTFRFEVKNTGNTPLGDVVLQDTLWLGTNPTVVNPASPVDASDLACYVGSASTPPADKSTVFTLGSPIVGLTVAPGATAWLYCDLPIPTSLTDAQITNSFIYDKAVITGTPDGTETPVTDDTQVVAVKVFPQAYDVYPVKTIVDADGTNPRAFEDLGRIDSPKVVTFRMFIDNVSETDQQVTLYDYFTAWTGLTAQQRKDVFDSMRCIDYDDPSADFPGGFPQSFWNAPDSGVTAEVFSNGGAAVDTEFGTADNAVSGGTKTDGKFYARSLSFVQEAGGGFEIACQLQVPAGDYQFTNVFRLVASPVTGGPQVESFSAQRLTGGGTEEATFALPAAAPLAVPADTGDLDLVAEAGVRAGTPVDEGTPTPTVTPTDTPTSTPSTPTDIPSTGGGDLPQTGGSAGVLLGWGLLLVVAGVLMTVVARRRDNGARHVG